MHNKREVRHSEQYYNFLAFAALRIGGDFNFKENDCMKTIMQISKQYNIAKTTLISRIKREKMIVLKSNKSFLITQEQEKILSKPVQIQGISYIAKNVNPLLVWQFKNENPNLSNCEISELLSIRENSVENILMNDEIILASKINYGR